MHEPCARVCCVGGNRLVSLMCGGSVGTAWRWYHHDGVCRQGQGSGGKGWAGSKRHAWSGVMQRCICMPVLLGAVPTQRAHESARRRSRITEHADPYATLRMHVLAFSHVISKT